jgi:alkaline phosphatase D
MLTRRDLLGGGAAAIALACTRRVSRAPAITHGVQVGDVGTGAALVWARCSEPARFVVEWDTTDAFANPHRVAGPVVTPESDHATTIALAGIPDAQTIVVRARFEREAERGASAWAMARFASPRADHVRVAWTGDTCGQGYGRNPEWGGMRGYAALRAAQPDVFVHSGDMIYADNPILATKQIPAGSGANAKTWRNITNDRVARVAQTIDDFRGRFEYNLDDDHVRALAAEVPIVAQWDDHEIHNNWWPGQQLDDDRYTIVRDASKLAAMARRAMIEWTPVPAGPVQRVIHYGPLLDIVVVDCRSFRSPNPSGDMPADMFGAAQAKWLADTLIASRARWKIVACDQPLGLVIPDGPDNSRREGFADGDRAVRGRERELATVFAALHAAPVKNVVWITADVHYAAAHRYDPARATVADFDPFWEFVAGPIHAGTFGPNELDPTFGPEAVFVWAPDKPPPPPAQAMELPPWDGLQSFGTIDVTNDALAVSLVGIDGRVRHRTEIPWLG